MAHFSPKNKIKGAGVQFLCKIVLIYTGFTLTPKAHIHKAASQTTRHPRASYFLTLIAK